jgi:hypothetical protein
LGASTRDRISVDLHGLKAALVARAQAEGVGVSVLVRRAVERELELPGASGTAQPAGSVAAVSAPTVKLSIRLTNSGAAQLAAAAHRAGLSRGAYLAGLVAGVPALTAGCASRPEQIAALNASCAELSTLSRNLNHLTSLLREGQLRAAMEYREMLRTLGADVRGHLSMAAALLSELRPARASHHPLEGDRHARTP